MPTNFFQMMIPQYFGCGAAAELGEKLKQMDRKKVLVMYDKGVESSGVPAKIIGYIEAAGVQVVPCNQVEADPSEVIITKIADLARAEKVDGIVAIGGGSSIDAAKGVKLLLNNDAPLSTFYDLSHPQKSGIPMVAVPTTSGTGSEASKGSVVTDTTAGVKRVIIGMGTMPDMAVIDPELVVGVPPKVTAACAFDVLAHAIDAITSKLTNPIIQSISYEAIRLMKGSYQQAVAHGDDIAARTDMHLAANLGGIALANAKCSMSHAFAHAMGALYHIPHGTCCAIFTPACLEFVADIRPAEIRKIADLLDVKYEADETPAAIAKRTGEYIYQMYRGVGLPNIAELIPDREEARRRIIPVAEKDIMAGFCPRKLDAEGADWIIDRTYALNG